MASSVFYKWGFRKDESRVTFDGTGISVFDLKREVILANNMGKANDFDLHVYDAATKQEFKDDSTIIPRSSSVIVKRLPASRPGKGKASMYVAGATTALPTSEPVKATPGTGAVWHKGSLSKRFDGKEEPVTSSITPKSSSTQPTSVKSAVTKDDEAAAMAAMFQAQTQNWEEAQEKMSHAQRIYTNPRGTGFSRGGKPHTPQLPAHHDRPLPPSYVCYRCGQKGHWIQDCPTNNDREFDNRPRIKRTTGIPRSMLKAVENPNTAELGQGVMVTPEGGYVVAQPDLEKWQKQVSRPKGLTAAEVRERAPSDSSLACPIDNKLFRDAVKTPCCGTAYCEECIQTHLLERDFVCPSCAKKIASLDKLLVDKPMRTKVADYIEKAMEESRKEGAEEHYTPGGKDGTSTPAEQSSMGTDQQSQDQEYYSDPQPDISMDMQILNPSLPANVRHHTEMQHQQLQIQLQQAQTMAAALAAATMQAQAVQQQAQMGMQAFQQNAAWNNQYTNQQQTPQDSAYQRLPVNNRRRNLKRERPSDFLEVGGESDPKMPRFWE
ncbi:DWNN domain-containing protein [Cyathus striatus]|nr:DWNN domain-containing protein [Cyathus striatus]